MLLPLSNFYLFLFQLHLHQTQCMWVSYLCICNNYTLCVCALLSHKRWNIRFNWQHVQAFIVSINEWRMQISLKFLYTRIYIINLNVLNWKHFRNSRAHLTNVFLFFAPNFQSLQWHLNSWPSMTVSYHPLFSTLSKFPML